MFWYLFQECDSLSSENKENVSLNLVDDKLNENTSTLVNDNLVSNGLSSLSNDIDCKSDITEDIAKKINLDTLKVEFNPSEENQNNSCDENEIENKKTENENQDSTSCLEIAITNGNEIPNEENTSNSKSKETENNPTSILVADSIEGNIFV